MKPFDLERALAGDPVVTRGGEHVKISGYNADAVSGHCVIGWRYPNYEMPSCCTWYENGNYVASNESVHDLFMAPQKREGWIVVIPFLRHHEVLRTRISETEAEAQKICDQFAYSGKHVAKIEWEE